jgi:hypothetical protein
MSTTTNPTKNVLGSDVETKGSLTFTGNINVQSVIVRGKINGNINAKEKIDLKAKMELPPAAPRRSARVAMPGAVWLVNWASRRAGRSGAGVGRRRKNHSGWE